MQVCEVCLLCHTFNAQSPERGGVLRVVGGLMPRAFIILPQLVSAIFFYVDRLPKRCTVMYFLYFLTRTIA